MAGTSEETTPPLIPACPLATAMTTLPPWDARREEPITRKPHPHFHNNLYYAKCMVGGIMSCGLTHTAVVPLDITKCRMQVFPKEYTGLISGFRKIVAEEGASGLKLGWGPTLAGYSMQGLCKFGLYEVFKDFYGNMAGEDFMAKNKGLIWCSASASAEFFADIALCPMEMVKVKVQTSPPGTWPTQMMAATSQMNAMKAETRFPFGSIRPLWGRQIPYTVAKFYFFEKIVQQFYDKVFTKPKDSYSKATQLSITFSSGYLAGVICAVVSQLPDNAVSQMGKPENKGKGFGTIVNEQGLKTMLTKGLGTRILMVGTLTGLQWWIYDTYKTAMGMGTTGGASTPSKK
eukprot:GHVN01074993.1.p1 GENE.GHVN01074993.1~~GHVN01074993.1.p1  ORF type:complete len:346 (+),score=33.74 GHVN01074993.1:198-1235(+)